MSDGLPLDPRGLREEVKAKYRAVAVDPSIRTAGVDPQGRQHFHTGRPLARRLGYHDAVPKDHRHNPMSNDALID